MRAWGRGGGKRKRASQPGHTSNRIKNRTWRAVVNVLMFWGIVVFVVVGASDRFVGVSQLGATVAALIEIFARSLLPSPLVLKEFFLFSFFLP